MDTQSSQKRSPRSSAKSKQSEKRAIPPLQTFDEDQEEQYADRSFDHVARVRAAKEAAQRRMEEFGDVSEYDVTILHGQLKEEPAVDSQPTLEFQREPDEES